MDKPSATASDEEKAPFTVKAFPVEARKLALAAAMRRGETMGQFLARAVSTQANVDAGDRIEMPSMARTNQGENQANPASERANLTAPDLADLMRSAAALAAATGIKPAVRDMQRAYAAMDSLVRAGTGAPPRPFRAPRSPPMLEADSNVVKMVRPE